MAVGEENGGGVRRRGCTFQKNDFFPEESFKSWGNYGRSVMETPFRLKDRVLKRSSDHSELFEVKARSGNEMKKTLNWWDLIWFGIGAVVGSGIFVLTGLEARQEAGPAVVLSFVVSGISALLSVFCYTEFAVEIPVAGGSFAYLRVELGDFVAFIAAGNILLEYVIGNAAVARSWTSYFATLCNRAPEDFRIIVHSMNPDYGHLDPIAVVALIVITALAVYSTKGSSIFNYVATIFHMFVIVFIIIAGLIKAKPENYSPFTPFGVHGMIDASAVLFFAYVGFDAVSTMAEETKNPGRDIPIGLVGSMLITTILYCLLATTLCLMQNYKDIDVNAPFSVAFSAVGMDWAKYIVSLGALKGMTTVLLVGAVGQARYLTHIARTHMMPPWFALVDHRTGTPMNATISMLVTSGVVAFFTDLAILSNLLSISTLFIFSLVALALLVRRYYSSGVTTKGDQRNFILGLVLIIGSSIGISAYWNNSTHGWIGYLVFVPLWILGTGGIWLFVPMAKKPTIWGVPLVPWLPSLSIAINIFLLGSIDKDSYIRFAVWTGLLLVYYILLGLHASYDTAKEFDQAQNTAPKEVQKQWNNVEQGV
ncbi:cationic amino acid transporter 1 [Cicer arietinum]|uniref:Cationic amino acid transporter 1 n=1 Tax=Cicer arietinum TaxID=3827 RepID=A0A1S3E8W7_CICAR|nr:cationic amino acid transporter 1 [Cicer arietinum]XP_004504163.1 cationic amino acid transporter 1 [Cicer arietinum]XP_012572262.1 cationic amino acid transporter 1 [Cicer arietinum]XP_027191131.1 cationic amino acid transporter 1 [Cicer arietinum]XP_027191132.1 cationic amino acid transporter 1 [Cicer arietinum]